MKAIFLGNFTNTKPNLFGCNFSLFHLEKVNQSAIVKKYQKIRKIILFSIIKCGKVGKNTIIVFTEKVTFLRQINVSTKHVTKELISRKFLSVIVIQKFRKFDSVAIKT